LPPFFKTVCTVRSIFVFFRWPTSSTMFSFAPDQPLFCLDYVFPLFRQFPVWIFFRIFRCAVSSHPFSFVSPNFGGSGPLFLIYPCHILPLQINNPHCSLGSAPEVVGFNPLFLRQKSLQLNFLAGHPIFFSPLIPQFCSPSRSALPGICDSSHYL